ncbi:hypothetical protein BsWGS_23812 [Bradybaena similaris]
MRAVCCVLVLLACLCLQTLGKSLPTICTLPPDVGPCKAAIPKYFYNPKTGTCEEFIYGGCPGNQNRFNNINACRTACG